jgi:lipid A 3-O-deacylase
MRGILTMMIVAAFSVAHAQGSFRLYVENDFFAGKEKGDKFFTNGLKFERITSDTLIPIFRKIFPSLDSRTSTAYSWAIGQNIYTASNIEVEEIIPNDRPYAGWLYFALRKFSNSSTLKRRVTSELVLGVMGPAALAGPVQKRFHCIINSPQPKGWDHQIRNNPGINYNIEIENELYNSATNHLDMIWFTNVEIGTVFDNFGVGATVRIAPFRALDSYFESTFSKYTTIRQKREGLEGSERLQSDEEVSKVNSLPLEQKKKFAMYLFVRPSVKFVAYNALLQGGIFNGRKNDRTISPNELERMYLNFDVGVVVPLGFRFDVVYGQSFRTSEFRNAPVHYWGFINLIYNQRK